MAAKVPLGVMSNVGKELAKAFNIPEKDYFRLDYSKIPMSTFEGIEDTPTPDQLVRVLNAVKPQFKNRPIPKTARLKDIIQKGRGFATEAENIYDEKGPSVLDLFGTGPDDVVTDHKESTQEDAYLSLTRPDGPTSYEEYTPPKLSELTSEQYSAFKRQMDRALQMANENAGGNPRMALSIFQTEMGPLNPLVKEYFQTDNPDKVVGTGINRQLTDEEAAQTTWGMGQDEAKPTIEPGVYNTPDDVKAQFKAGLIDKDQATEILKTKFGYE